MNDKEGRREKMKGERAGDKNEKGQRARERASKLEIDKWEVENKAETLEPTEMTENINKTAQWQHFRKATHHEKTIKCNQSHFSVCQCSMYQCSGDAEHGTAMLRIGRYQC